MNNSLVNFTKGSITMNRAQRISERVLAHIDAFMGAGKTTLMHELQKEFPEVLFRDVDDFIEYDKASKKVGRIRGKYGIWSPLPDDKAEEFYRLVDKYTHEKIEQWTVKQKKDVVLVGMGYMSKDTHRQYPEFSKDYAIEAEKKILYNVAPFRVAFRDTKRLLNIPSLETLMLILRTHKYRQEYLDTFHGARTTNKALRNRGYEPLSAKGIRKEIAHLIKRT
jgi:shikimate kinase